MSTADKHLPQKLSKEDLIALAINQGIAADDAVRVFKIPGVAEARKTLIDGAVRYVGLDTANPRVLLIVCVFGRGGGVRSQRILATLK